MSGRRWVSCAKAFVFLGSVGSFTQAWAGPTLLTKPYTFATGDLISAARVNSNFDMLYRMVPQLFSASTTYTTPSGTQMCVIEAMGGGGGGGGGAQSTLGAGGSPGGYAKGIYPVSGGALLTVNIGVFGSPGSGINNCNTSAMSGSPGTSTTVVSGGSTLITAFGGAGGGGGTGTSGVCTTPTPPSPAPPGTGNMVNYSGPALPAGTPQSSGPGAAGIGGSSGSNGIAGTSGMVLISCY